MKIITIALLCFTLTMLVAAQTSHPPTVAEAEAFMKKAEARLAELSVKVNQANWVHDNFITDDTEALAAAANDEITAVTTELVEQAKPFDGLQLPPDLARKFLLLKLSLTAPAPKDPALRKNMARKSFRPLVRFPRICSAIPGRRPGAMFFACSGCLKPAAATTSPNFFAQKISTRTAW